MEVKILLTLLLVALIAHAIYHLFKMACKVNDMEKRLVVLEKTRSTRIPYQAALDILNARAALNREKEEYQFFVSLIENAEGHLEKAMSVGTKKE